MGPIPFNDSDGLYFMDLYISSHTPTLSALIESRKSRSQPITPDEPSLLLVAHPRALHGAWGKIAVVQAVGSPVATLVSATATPETVVEGLKDHRFAYFIVRSQLPTAKFALLSAANYACHTAELTEDSIADEGLHLAAATQFCGFRSMIGTMWAMADTDGTDLSKPFYK
ncbi:hypothetical protein EDB83DRAFT_2674418 [Lactarius deliciosus]|nr:hypothetical protein EDB83DRAFT_2674418 [Lactarius deliciosus]